MPRYMVTRTLPPLSDEELQAVGRRVVETCRELGDVQWIHSHLSADGKHSFCEFEAPSEELVREHARRAELPVDAITPLGLEIGPKLFG